MPSANILQRLYPPDQIFVRNPRFVANQPIVTVTCCMPEGPGYFTIPTPYVTAENYVRILSQASYLLGYHIIEHGLVTLPVTPKKFLEAMMALQLFYRNLAMTFHEITKRGQAFEMELALRDFRLIRRLQDFIIFTFANKRTVISGEMSFVYVGPPHPNQP